MHIPTQKSTVNHTRRQTNGQRQKRTERKSEAERPLDRQAHRHLFAHLLLHCELSNPLALWEQFREELSEDFYHLCKQQTAAYDGALDAIQKILSQNGKHLADDYGLPLPKAFDRTQFTNKDLLRERRYDAPEERTQADSLRAQMYDEQGDAYDAILDSVHTDTPAVFFIDGPGGSGKTFLYSALLHAVRGDGDIALACAWSGIAAVLLEGGRTCHSRFGLPVPLPRTSVSSSIKVQSSRAVVLREAKLIVWDEAPMAPSEALECVDQLLRDVMDTPDLPFGGKVLVLGGDFRQVLPVMPHCSRDDVVAHSLKAHPLWKAGFVQIKHLTHNKRAELDVAWREYLLRIGDGAEPISEDVGPFSIRLPDDICAPQAWTTYDLCEHTFPNLLKMSQDALAHECREEFREYFSGRALLAPTNKEVDQMNAAILARFPAAQGKTYFSTDSADTASPAEAALWPIDFLNSLTPSGMPPHELRIIPGVLIMLLRNIDADNGLCNGVRGIVMNTLKHVLDVVLISGTGAGHRVYIPRMTLAPKNPDLPFVLRRRQFPVKLAWAMTINKAQGQTLLRAGLYLPTPV